MGELEKRLWDAANALSGPVDPADFKTYVFPILFWKWISDIYDWERAQAVDEYGEDVAPEVEADFHKFDVPAGTHWREVTTKTANLGAAVVIAKQEDESSMVFGDWLKSG